jgi:uncharacterized protein YndB with AHSA1/START domain/DNA-binding transcriptional ArsR family regulator
MQTPTNVHVDDIRNALAALSEPTRFRILLLLAERPHTVGEVAQGVGALQPQTTKHLQTLESAGVVRVHRLGRRRVASLDRDRLSALADWLGSLTHNTPDDETLERYVAAADAASARAAESDTVGTLVHLVRAFAVPREVVWRAWTDPVMLADWWAPRHFIVDSCVLEPVPGGRVELTLREADGARYSSRGTTTTVRAGHRLEFTLAPVDGDGRPLLDTAYALELTGESECRMELTIRARATTPDAAALIAGLEPGWSELVDALDDVLQDYQQRRIDTTAPDANQIEKLATGSDGRTAR